MCALNNTKTPQQVMSFFVLFLYRIFHFLHFLFKKSLPLMASSNQQRPNGASAPLSKYKLVFLGVRSCYHRPLLSFAFCFLFSGALSLSFFFFFFFVTLFVFKSLLSRRSFFLFVVIFPEMIKELPPKKKKKKKKEKQRKSAASRHRFGFVVVLLKKNASLTFPLYVFNRTNRLGKRPSSLASCTTNSTRRTKRRSASIFYRKRYTWRILEAFDYNCGIQLARSDFDR